MEPTGATLSRTFRALGDPTRRTVVRRLADGPATVGVLAAEHAMSLPAFTKHVAVLVDAGLVTRRRVGRTVECALRPAALAEAHAWLGDMRSFWTASLDRLEALLDDERQDDR
ncbi:ArsR/SmtB family transcription factor [Actinotalea solisilvae]|uniref:ArsR/SmtB family transcription factor n=1 Tax=Actinotalea solisilvae TaxID=2072922 RepID=UPI0027DC671A|nr:metalloregulator ArsR/SmtB family transcription factor [Actinotalea solisilvae]